MENKKETIVIRPKTREEWLEIRKHGIGASEVASVIGVSPFESKYQLWRRKRGMDAPKAENEAMRFGHYLEDAVSQMWQNATGAEVIARSKGDWIIRDKNRPWLQVSPDRTYWSAGDKRNDANKKLLEIKSTRMVVDPNDLPPHWFCQIEYQLGVSGYKEGSLAWLSSAKGFDFGYVDVTFVPDFYEWIEEEVERFWIDNVVGGKEPDAETAEDVLLKYARHKDGKVIEATPEVVEAYAQLKGVKAELKALDEKKDRLENTIKLAFGDAEALSTGGKVIATWKASKTTRRLDDKAFVSANPELAEQYMKDVAGTRRFILK